MRLRRDPMSIRSILFDIDGTLVDSNEFHVLAWQRAFEASGFTLSPDLIRQQIGKGADMLIPALLPHVDERLLTQIAEHHDRTFRADYLPKVQPFEHAAALVRAVADRGCAVVLASSSNRDDVDHYIDLLGIRSLLAGATTADDVAHSKPAGDIFAAAMKRLANPRPSATVVVGDTPYDVIAAAKCRLGTIALRSGGFSEEQLRSAGALAVYEGVGDLLANLERSPIVG
jgi:HAD superfamily hydrolase (TIGR01509 family)